MKYDYNSKEVQRYLQRIILTAEDGMISHSPIWIGGMRNLHHSHKMQ